MNILVIHASAGAGHLKAAESLHNGLRKYTDHNVVLVDALDLTSPYFKKLYRGMYFFMISKVPWLWGFCFAAIDIGMLQPLIRLIRRGYNRLNAGRLHAYLRKEQFDYVISSHFMPTEVVAALKRAGKITSTLITVITDYDVHKIWLAEGVDHYCVASDWTKTKMKSLGIKENKVIATGVPTDEKFSAPVDVGALKQKLGLKENIFTVLVATGSFGIGPIEEIIRELKEFQVIVVCGHNTGLYDRLSTFNNPLVKVFGLVDNMHELMAVSDAMVTKPGGLSVSEALVSQLALIFFSAIPGQETGNIRVLKEHGIGLSNCTIKEIGTELVKMKFSRDAFSTTLKRTKQLARPNAVKDIIALIP